MCKSSDVFSLAVLIDRGLDLCTKGGIVLGFLGAVVVDAPPLPFLLLSLFSSQGIHLVKRFGVVWTRAISSVGRAPDS